MYIEPNTVIRLLKNCPLDNTYDHTIYFSGVEAQVEYFSSLTKYTLTQQTYQRVNRSRMRVQYKADNLYDCNYLMFQNTNFGNKWFYAFIKSVEYVNNITSEIEYEIDVMQTWAFDYQLGQCFVDREHAVTDNVGDNLVPENLEHGEYVTTGVTTPEPLNELALIVAATFDENYNDKAINFYSGLYSGLHFNVFTNDTAGAVLAGQFIQNAGAKSDGIVGVFVAPRAMFSDGAPKNYEVLIKKFNALTRSNGAVVKNNKMLTYPYNFLYVTNQQGNSAFYRYELFDGERCKFTYTGDMSMSPSVVIAPNDYKGVSGTNYDEKMVLSGFPQLPYNTDAFKAWLAQNGNSLALDALSTALSGGFGIANSAINQQFAKAKKRQAYASLDAAQAVSSPLLAVAGTLGTILQHSMQPYQAKGGGGSQVFAALGLLNFLFMHKHIQPQFVDIIDDYFNMYGYATHRVKVPNRNVRPYWTYTKTIGCVIHGSVPCDDMSKICSIFDNGITFWTSGANIGNYSLDNRPKGGAE